MGNFNRDKRPNGFGGGRSKGGFGGGRSSGNRFGGAKRNFGDRDFNRPQMHQATCAECGKRCEVPFKPTGDKPVYCSDCFGHSPNYGSQRAKGGRNFERRDFGETQMFKATCADCGEMCEVPFKPSNGKPVFCSDCFGGGSRSESTKPMQRADDAGVAELREAVIELGVKLDKVLLLLQRTTPVKEITVMKSEKVDAEESKKLKSKASKSEPLEAPMKPKGKVSKREVGLKAPKKVVAKSKTTVSKSTKKPVTKKATKKK